MVENFSTQNSDRDKGRKSKNESIDNDRDLANIEIKTSNISISAAEKARGSRRKNVAISQNDIFAHQTLKNNPIFVLPDPKIPYHSSVQPFNICFEDIFERSRFQDKNQDKTYVT